MSFASLKTYKNSFSCYTHAKANVQTFILHMLSSTGFPVPPAAPSVSVNGTNVTVTWNDVANETGYDAYLIQAPWGWNDVKYSVHAGPDYCHYTFTNVTPGTYAAFVISRPNSDQTQSPPTYFEVPALPAAPTVSASPATIYEGQSTTISWNAVPGATSYYVHAFNASTGEDFFSTNIGAATSQTLTFGAGKAATYSVAVSSVNSVGGYTSAAPVTVTVKGKPAGAPAVQVNSTTCVEGETTTLTWNAVSGATDYRIRVYDESGSETFNASVGNVTSHSFNFAEGVHRIYVDAVNPAGTISSETPITVTVKPNNEGSCGDHATWRFSNGVLTISGTGEMTSHPWTKNFADQIQTVIIEPGVTSIGSSAFSNCDILTSVMIPAGVTSIGDSAFFNCCSLTSVTIPAGVTSIGSQAFSDCDSLTSITIPGSVTGIDSYAFYYCTSLTSVTIQPGVTSIGAYAFCECNNLTSISIPDSVTSIGGLAFCNCSSLTNIKIPDGVTFLGERAFIGCSSLTSVTIPSSVTSIHNKTFQDCANLTSVSIPASVTSIGSEAFVNCNKLTDVHFCGTEAQRAAMTIGDSNDPLTNASWTYGHLWDAGVVTVAPTTTSEGMKTFTCTACGETKTEVIPCVQVNPFTDVAAGKFYYEPVLWAISQDPVITTGVTDTTFMPDRICTRAHVVTFLWRANGCPEPTDMTNTFKDVPNGKYYTKAVLWAAETGITTGYSDGTFRPDDECPRGQVVTFLWRAKGSPKPTGVNNPFSDVPTGKYYTSAILWALKNNITQGRTATTFGPDDACTRGHVVTFLYRAYH